MKFGELNSVAKSVETFLFIGHSRCIQHDMTLGTMLIQSKSEVNRIYSDMN